MYFSTIEPNMLLKTQGLVCETKLRLTPKRGTKRAQTAQLRSIPHVETGKPVGGRGGYIDSMPNRDERRKLTEDMHGLSRRPTICLGQPLAPRPRAPESCHLPGHSGVDL